MTIPVEKANEIIQPLRDAGYAVTIFTPEELNDYIAQDEVEEAMICAGNDAITNAEALGKETSDEPV